ncbi:hypothetical protein H8958_000991 [Nasalis larvatus]
MGDMTAIMVNQSLPSSFRLEVDLNIQAVCTQEKEQIKTLDKKSASFINKLWFLEQQNKVLDTKWSLLQQQKMAGNNLDEPFKSHINTLWWQLDILGLTDEINFLKQLYEGDLELLFQISDTSVVLSMDNSCSLDMDSIITKVCAQYEDISNHSQAKAESTYQIKYEELQKLSGKHWDDLHCTKKEISEMTRNMGLRDQRVSLETAIRC